MIEKLEEIVHRFEEVGQLMVQPDVMSDMNNFTKLSKGQTLKALMGFMKTLSLLKHLLRLRS